MARCIVAIVFSLLSVVDAHLILPAPVDLQLQREDVNLVGKSSGIPGLQPDIEYVPSELSSPTLCDSTVKQHSGFLNASDGVSYFFWMFESRGSPSEDPLVLWLTGGPGCSSQMAALRENGPCHIGNDGKITRNEHSWNTRANIMYVDQPAATGFSTGHATKQNQAAVAQKIYTFMQEFYKSLPQYRANHFYLFGSSYAGHYVPAASHFIWQQSKTSNDFKIPLKGIGIGNGLTHPEEQYKWYPDMAKDGGKSEGGSLQKGVVTGFAKQASMRAASKNCIHRIRVCNETGDYEYCAEARAICAESQLQPYQKTGYNIYDMRLKCKKPPLCDDYTAVENFLNSFETQKQLGVRKKWEYCNMAVVSAMNDDYMKSYHHHLPDMLADGIRVIIYAGDADYICNWLGNKRWTLGLEWPHKAEFNDAADEDFLVDGRVAGRLRKAKGFHFLQVYEAGHMVPTDQPAAALKMINDFISDNMTLIESTPDAELPPCRFGDCVKVHSAANIRRLKR